MSIFALAATATLLTRLVGAVEPPPDPRPQFPALTLDAGRSFGARGSWVAMAGLREDFVLLPAQVEAGGFSLALQTSVRGWIGHFDGIQISPSVGYDFVNRAGNGTVRLGADWIAGGGAWGIGPAIGFDRRFEDGWLAIHLDAGMVWRGGALQAFVQAGVSFDLRIVGMAPLFCVGGLCCGPGFKTT